MKVHEDRSHEDRLHEDLRTLAADAEILSPRAYTLRGERRELAPAAADAEDGGTDAEDGGTDEDPAPPALLLALETDLYTRLYCRLADRRPAAAARLADGTTQRAHLGALSAANSGRGSWEPGWRIVERDPDGRVAVVRDEVTFWVEPSGLRIEGEITPGAFCRVRLGKELRNLVPGFYVAIGDGDAAGSEHLGALVRLYWHLEDAGAAVAYMAATTHILNATGVPFRTKVMADPGGYLRADAGVLYLERRHYRRLRPALGELYEKVAGGLRPELPLFTRRLRPGLGLAEDPSDGASFGQSRCRLAARGLWRAYRAGGDAPAGRARALAETFAAAGLDPGRPWLEPGSEDAYALGPGRGSRRAVRGRR